MSSASSFTPRDPCETVRRLGPSRLLGGQRGRWDAAYTTKPHPQYRPVLEGSGSSNRSDRPPKEARTFVRASPVHVWLETLKLLVRPPLQVVLNNA